MEGRLLPTEGPGVPRRAAPPPWLLVAASGHRSTFAALTGEAPRPPPAAGLPKAEFTFPGPLRDRLVAAILDGSRTSTTGLAIEYELEAEPLARAG